MTLYATLYSFADIVGQLEDADALSETGASVLGCLEQARNDGCLENAEQPSLLIQFSKSVLAWANAAPQYPLPLGMLNFQSMERGEQAGGLALGASGACPSSDVVIARRLLAIFKLGDFRGLP